MSQNAIIDNVTLNNVEARVGASGYPYAMLHVTISQPGKGGMTESCNTSIMCGKPDMYNSMQAGAVYQFEMEPRVGKPGDNGSRYLNLNLKNAQQTGGAQAQFNAPAQNQAPAQGQPQMQQAPMRNQAPMQQAQAPATAPAPQGNNGQPGTGFDNAQAPQGTNAPNAYADFSEEIPF